MTSMSCFPSWEHLRGKQCADAAATTGFSLRRERRDVWKVAFLLWSQWYAMHLSKHADHFTVFGKSSLHGLFIRCSSWLKSSARQHKCRDSRWRASASDSGPSNAERYRQRGSTAPKRRRRACTGGFTYMPLSTQVDRAKNWQEARLKAKLLTHPLFSQMLHAHVGCLRKATPVDQLPKIDEQLCQSQSVINRQILRLRSSGW